MLRSEGVSGNMSFSEHLLDELEEIPGGELLDLERKWL